MVRFVVDAQLPPGLASRLQTHGHRAEHVNRIGLGPARDATIWEYAARTGSVLVTKDSDFVAMARADTSGPQVVWIRIGKISNDALWRSIGPVLNEIVQSIEAGDRVIEVV